MKTLSVRQPWAWLIVQGYKHIENRPWTTKVRGEILIHAGKTFDRVGYAWVRLMFPTVPMPRPEEFERGGIVGRVTLVDCVTDVESRWACGPQCFVLKAPLPLPFMPVRGLLGFFEVDYQPPAKRSRSKGLTF